MTQPTFAEGPPVPLMVEGIISSETLRQLFADLVSAATSVQVREKGAPTSYTTAENMPLDLASERLLNAEACAVQVQYQFADAHWTDTIFRVAEGFRVVRCKAD